MSSTEAQPMAAGEGALSMKALRYEEYGSPDVLRLESIERPTPREGEVLVRVRAASVNPYDWHCMRGEPRQVRMLSGLERPNPERRTLGADFAGTVVSAGAAVTAVQPGDEVFGMSVGAFAEFIAAPEGRLARKPPGVTHEAAAAIPIAGLTALQALRRGGIEAGQRVLVNGASGGVGTFAVQIAKSFGAVVTGVCSTRNVELVRSIGADAVVDYTLEDFTTSEARYDLILDAVGSPPLADCRRALSDDGVLVTVANAGAAESSEQAGPGRVTSMTAKVNAEDLAHLATLVGAGSVTPVIDRGYPLDAGAEAVRYLETGHARGKVVLVI